MIARFDAAVPLRDSSESGLTAIQSFISDRIGQVCDSPDLAWVMFAEELFIDDPEFEGLMVQLIRRHRIVLSQHFQFGQERGEFRADIAIDILFRLVFGPVRLLVRQWGMTGHAFDLRTKGDELLEAVTKILQPTEQGNLVSKKQQRS